MNTELISGPGRYPVTLAEAKKQVEIATADTSHDNYLKKLIADATEFAESFTGRKLIFQTHKLYLANWPSLPYILLPFGQLKSVSTIKYSDSDGNQTTWDSLNYIIRTGDYGYVALAYGISWPCIVLYPVNPIEIQFSCGYYSGKEWVLETSYSEGDIVVPTGYSGSFAYQAGGDGTSDSIEPSWPSTIGGEVVDNDITWTNLGLTVPFSIRAGILLHIAGSFGSREPYVDGPRIQLKTVERMLWGAKIW